jgi:hypothetical protein
VTPTEATVELRSPVPPPSGKASADVPAGNATAHFGEIVAGHDGFTAAGSSAVDGGRAAGALWTSTDGCRWTLDGDPTLFRDATLLTSATRRGVTAVAAGARYAADTDQIWPSPLVWVKNG